MSTNVTDHAADLWLCTALRSVYYEPGNNDNQSAWPGAGTWDIERLVQRAGFHGIAPLLYYSLKQADRAGLQQLTDALRPQALAHAMWERRHQATMEEVLEAMHKAGLPALLFKGTALAYSIYETPVLRSRADTDLMVDANDRLQAAAILHRLGFKCAQSLSGRYVSYEATFVRNEGAQSHFIDLHWRIHYSWMESTRLGFDALLARSSKAPLLSPYASIPCHADAFMIAALHRANDLVVPQWRKDQPVWGSERLMPLYDFYLLARTMQPEDWEYFLEHASLRGLLPVCRDAIVATRDCLSVFLPQDIEKALVGALDSDIQRYLGSGMIRQKWMDMQAMPGMRSKLAFLREHLFPPADYLLDRFQNSSDQPLSWLVLRRLGAGAARRLRRGSVSRCAK